MFKLNNIQLSLNSSIQNFLNSYYFFSSEEAKELNFLVDDIRCYSLLIQCFSIHGVPKWHINIEGNFFANFISKI